MSEPLDLDALERTCADCCETVSEVIAECRALRAEVDELRDANIELWAIVAHYREKLDSR